MRKIDKEALLLYSELKSYKQKVLKALAVIDEALSKTDKWYMALSGGKDSTVVFDLVRKKENIMAIWSDDEFYLPETKDYIERLKDNEANIHQIQTKTKHTDWFMSNSNSEISSIQEYAKMHNCSGGFLGLRAEENKQRRAYLANFGLLFYVKKDELWQCNPIGWWGYKDVWAYILSNNIDYNRAYDRLSDIGIELNKQRIGPYATDRALGYGQLAILKKGWPNEYQKFKEKFKNSTAYV